MRGNATTSVISTRATTWCASSRHLPVFARQLALTDVNDSAGTHHLFVKAQHMRFLHEARAGAASACDGASAQLGPRRRRRFVSVSITRILEGGSDLPALDRLRRARQRPARAMARAAPRVRPALCFAKRPVKRSPAASSLDNVDVTASLERAAAVGNAHDRTSARSCRMPVMLTARAAVVIHGRVADSIPHLRNGEWRKCWRARCRWTVASQLGADRVFSNT